MGKLIITDHKEKFSRSKCNCKICKDMITVNLDWEKFEAKTNLQKRMKNVIDKIEKRELEKMKKEK